MRIRAAIRRSHGSRERPWRRVSCGPARQSMEGASDRSRTTSRDRSRENSRERPAWTSQRPSSEGQIDENYPSPRVGGPTSPSLHHSSGNAGRLEAAGRNKRRQVAAEEQGQPLPAIRIINRHIMQAPRGSSGGGKGGHSGARGAGRSSSSPSSPASAYSRPGSSRRTGPLAKGKLRAGVYAVEAVADLSNLLLSRGSASGSGGGGSFGGAAGGASGGGVGPAVGSPQEAALVGERRGPSLVSPHICIGAKEDAKDLSALKELGVTHVLNCAKQLPSSHPREFVHARLELIDSSDEELAPFQKAGVSFLRQVEGSGGRALVHCIAGCSRSVSIVLLHLMESHRIRLKLAYDHVRSYRMVAQPNEGFRFQLATTEVKLFGSSTVSRDAESIWNFYRWNEVKQGVPYQAVDPPRSCGGCAVA